MSRKPHDPIEPDALPGAVPGHAITLTEEAAVRQDESAAMENAMTVASQVGYDGSLTLGAIEDEIRFFQRRTVEAILETGKRLLVMRELTPHGEFEKRVELLGFSTRTAQRFMQAASKTAKSAILADLSKQVKNGSAFLELITHDDDSLKSLAEMDEIDRMGPSELRAALKEARETTEARDTVIKNKQARLDQIEEENFKLKRRVETTTPDEAVLEIRKEADRIALVAEHEVSANLRKAFDALAEMGGQHSEFMLGLITQIELACDVLRGDFGLLKAGPDGDSTPYWERNNQPAVN
jgi:hypothetical protein